MDGVDEIVNGEVLELDGVEKVRISRKSFEKLNAKLRPFLEKPITKTREPIFTTAQMVQDSSEA